MGILLPKGLGMLEPQDSSFELGIGSSAGGLAGYPPPPPPPPNSNALAALLLGVRPDPRSALVNALAGAALTRTKRKAYFAFRFQDIMRVNNVRKAWCIAHPESSFLRSFYDRSIWGKSKAREPDALKALMRGAVVHSSAICVLIGTNTWQGRWVKYEIARAIIDERGLLAVHINGLNHIERKMPDPLGYNPLNCMGVFHSPVGRYYLYENKVEVNPQTGQLGWAWRPYEDFKDAVPLPRYIPFITQGYVMPLSRYTSTYDYKMHNGDVNIGSWIDSAAVAVGR